MWRHQLTVFFESESINGVAALVKSASEFKITRMFDVGSTSYLKSRLCRSAESGAIASLEKVDRLSLCSARDLDRIMKEQFVSESALKPSLDVNVTCYKMGERTLRLRGSSRNSRAVRDEGDEPMKFFLDMRKNALRENWQQ
jgi:hypothetical protein